MPAEPTETCIYILTPINEHHNPIIAGANYATTMPIFYL